MASKLQKYARKSAKNGLCAHLSALTRQIAAALSSFGYESICLPAALRALENRRGYRRARALQEGKLIHTISILFMGPDPRVFPLLIKSKPEML